MTPKEWLTSGRRRARTPVYPRDCKVVRGPRRKRWWRAGSWPLKAKFRIEGDWRLYTTKPGAEAMDVACAPVTACRACKNAGWGVACHPVWALAQPLRAVAMTI